MTAKSNGKESHMSQDPYKGNATVLDDTRRQRPNIYESRLRLLHKALTTTPEGEASDPGSILSIGVGSGIFETLLNQRYGIEVRQAIEPSASLGAQARAKGLNTIQATAQEFDYDQAPYDTIIYNGSSFGFIPDDEIVDTFTRNRNALSPNGRIVLTDVPAESALGLVLRLRQTAGLDDALVKHLLEGTAFFNVDTHLYKPYWHEIPWYDHALKEAGFERIGHWQTLLENPPYHNEEPHDPEPGYQRGNYVAIVAGI
ncbi:MAG: class I SAM-dependent methyltransferase [Bifidobacterium merycicum]|uniref:Methyltransferase domain protein n=2 Tax=Bifidobacterium TaxID=1678 RepID=A0A087D1V9_BIFRU|nr:class I SAM-dependent methyltransferase [Bifidobacterium ruminantium]KFI89509.1 methyltransferase domain protein [Bifidobacterium ruminantium]MEE3341737.1 class I SAM-dependent methyltransferase [Bifidobacterium merycicum]